MAALLAALVVTALCVTAALYAMRLSVLVLMHWQAMVAFSALLYLIPMLVVALRRKRQVKLQAAEDAPLTPVARRPLREL
ncbi:MAG TPA: hypothetical protein VMU31_10345 [Rhizomicrobium sp.]|nr:hypothetical protein [Rhizomicrobium sp.]